MKQLDRQLLILTRLRENRAVTARNLAAACECSVRTIYRDVNSLCEAGVPVAAMPGEGYRLAAGYHLPRSRSPRKRPRNSCLARTSLQTSAPAANA